MICRILFVVFTVTAYSLNSSAEVLSKIPITQLKIVSQTIKLSKISDVLGRSITTTRNQLIINDGRNLWSLRNDTRVMRKMNLDSLPEDANWFSTVCATDASLFVAVNDYPEEQRDEELDKSRGNFIRGPSAKGFLTISPSSDLQYTSAPTITSRPSTSSQINPNPEATFTYEIQSCAWNGSALYFGSYGALGKVNITNSTIDIIDEDDGQSLSRFPLIADKDGLWYVVDTGGLEGAVLTSQPVRGKRKYYSIDNGEDIVSYTALVKHHGQIAVGTTHGLFVLNQSTGKFKRIKFGSTFKSEFISSLFSYDNYLWVFAGGNWLRVDLVNSKAVHFTFRSQSDFFTGAPLDDSWLLLSSEGVWINEGITPRSSTRKAH